MSVHPVSEADEQRKHIDYYRQNQAYTRTLVDRDIRLFAKYADALKVPEAGARLLDVGCGAGHNGSYKKDIPLSSVQVPMSPSQCRLCSTYPAV